MEEDSPTVAGYYDGGKQALNKVGTDLRNPPIRARIECSEGNYKRASNF